MTGFVLPENLVDSVRSDRSPQRDAWLAGLPRLVDEVAGRWSLTVGPPFQPGGRSAWVAPARDRDGRDLVLKLAWRHDEARDEAAGLRAWDGGGVVRLYADATIAGTSVLLLERCRPGIALGETLPEVEQDRVVAGLLKQLWQAPADPGTFRPLQVMADSWAAEFQQRLADTPGRVDPGLARAAFERWRTLPATADRQVLLATDLHAGNILAADREPWLVIDPKPYLGDPTYDPVQHLLNCEQRLTADPVGLTCRMAGLLDLDPDRLRQWLFARCVQESLDEPGLLEVAAELAAR
ncbi:aminoglycoside phosphotransferase family protein [Phytohabitans houttuyneae]|uniref:aminoglycoside phosphotransferase family protein n=1 Tax=Phytohabitans houttuyneae TaxID=1076126 RepID=UPI001C49B912|nr:aminoglycoside phosphotransferase family protein [Phytohabitans houttuyneae]